MLAADAALALQEEASAASLLQRGEAFRVRMGQCNGNTTCQSSVRASFFGSSPDPQTSMGLFDRLASNLCTSRCLPGQVAVVKTSTVTVSSAGIDLASSSATARKVSTDPSNPSAPSFTLPRTGIKTFNSTMANQVQARLVFFSSNPRARALATPAGALSSLSLTLLDRKGKEIPVENLKSPILLSMPLPATANCMYLKDLGNGSQVYSSEGVIRTEEGCLTLHLSEFGAFSSNPAKEITRSSNSTPTDLWLSGTLDQLSLVCVVFLATAAALYLMLALVGLLLDRRLQQEIKVVNPEWASLNDLPATQKHVSGPSSPCDSPALKAKVPDVSKMTTKNSMHMNNFTTDSTQTTLPLKSGGGSEDLRQLMTSFWEGLKAQHPIISFMFPSKTIKVSRPQRAALLFLTLLLQMALNSFFLGKSKSITNIIVIAVVTSLVICPAASFLLEMLNRHREGRTRQYLKSLRREIQKEKASKVVAQTAQNSVDSPMVSAATPIALPSPLKSLRPQFANSFTRPATPQSRPSTAARVRNFSPSSRPDTPESAPHIRNFSPTSSRPASPERTRPLPPSLTPHRTSRPSSPSVKTLPTSASLAQFPLQAPSRVRLPPLPPRSSDLPPLPPAVSNLTPITLTNLPELPPPPPVTEAASPPFLPSNPAASTSQNHSMTSTARRKVSRRKEREVIALSLPPWADKVTLVGGYVLCAAVIGIASFFVLAYGLKFSPETARNWVLSVIICNLGSILVVDLCSIFLKIVLIWYITKKKKTYMLAHGLRVSKEVKAWKRTIKAPISVPDMAERERRVIEAALAFDVSPADSIRNQFPS
eukprot:GILI01013098.1.p1 GENE.GILI01013098.1~~GILI01013098.1.p1  ORF type:complete len:864 (+),score=130.27 GILI01013098.1:131-2593(+)